MKKTANMNLTAKPTAEQIYGVIRSPLVTEKTTLMQQNANIVAFRVDARATKPQVKAAVEQLFNVQALKVAMLNTHGKLKRIGRADSGRRANLKKAYVTLAAGQSIALGNP